MGIALLVGWIPTLAMADGPVTTVYFDTGSAMAARGISGCPAPVTVVRRMGDGHEEVVEPLLDCDRHVRAEALRAVSILARPRGVERPTQESLAAFDSGSAPGLLCPDVRLLHAGLLERLQRLSEAFDGRPIEILSGYRPSSAETSRHHHGRALDLRVQGVDRARVRDIAVGFERSGVGWYPNSIFVHLDVRERSTYWVDVSGPGEPARYITNAQPPTPEAPTAEPRQDEPTRDEPPTQDEPPTEAELDAIERETSTALFGIRVDAPASQRRLAP